MRSRRRESPRQSMTSRASGLPSGPIYFPLRWITGLKGDWMAPCSRFSSKEENKRRQLGRPPELPDTPAFPIAPRVPVAELQPSTPVSPPLVTQELYAREIEKRDLIITDCSTSIIVVTAAAQRLAVKRALRIAASVLLCHPRSGEEVVGPRSQALIEKGSIARHSLQTLPCPPPAVAFCHSTSWAMNSPHQQDHNEKNRQPPPEFSRALRRKGVEGD